MNTLFGIATVLVAFTISFTRAGPPGPHGPPMCNGKEVMLPETAEPIMKTCHEKIFAGAKPDKDSKKFLCMMGCQAQQLGVVDDTGKILDDKLASFFQGALPKDTADTFISKFKECMKTNGDKITISDTDCSDSEKLFDCGRAALQDTCK